MSLHTVQNLKDSVAGILSGIDLNNVDSLNACLERAAATLVQNADIPEASHIQNIVLYSGVFNYACDPTIFGAAINDIRPQGISRIPSDIPIKTTQETFDRTKSVYYPSGTMSTFEFHNGVPVIRIVSPYPKQQVIMDQMNTIGTTPNAWVAAGSASNLTVDYTDFYQSPASLRFTLTGSSSGTLTKTLQNPLSMADYEGVGTAFLAIQIPAGATATDLTNIILKIGSDSGNYSSVTATTGFLGAWVSGEWLLVSFDFSTATTTGTPDWSAIDYVQITLNHTATLTNFRVGNLFMSLPTPAQILFQSSAIFLPTGTSTPLETITLDTDTIILTRAAYTLYEYESAFAVCQQVGGVAGTAMLSTISKILQGTPNNPNDTGLYAKYRGDNPSQELRTIDSWYDNSPSYNSGFYGIN